MEVELDDYNVHTSAQEQADKLWKSLVDHNSALGSDAASSTSNGTHATGAICPADRKWPTYDTVVAHVTSQDYKKNLVCPHDVVADTSKTICPHGSVCCAKIELFPFPTKIVAAALANKPYTGLLTPGTTVEHCMVRLSSAIRPLEQGIESDFARTMIRNAVGEKLANAKIVPGAAIKAFRGNNVPSGNLLFLGSKVGQREEDYFAHCLSTSMTEKMPTVALPFLRKFSRYSSHPLALGCSDWCAQDAEGNDHTTEEHQNFPYIITLKPVIERPTMTTATAAAVATTSGTKRNSATFDSFIDEVTTIPVGTTLFDLYASPDPESVGDPSRIQRIGRIMTTSEMISSAPTDGIFFRHQIKEEDFELRPEWKSGIDRKVAMDGGKTKGTVGKLAGWRLFEEDIALGQYVDFEASSSSSSS